VGSEIEINPLIRLTNPFVMAIIIKIFVIWIGWKLAKEYTAQKDMLKFMTVSFIILCAFLQFAVSCSNAYVLSKIDFGVKIATGEAELVKTEIGYNYVVDSQIVREVNPIEKNSFSIILFYSIIILFALYPMIFANLSFWLKRKIDDET